MQALYNIFLVILQKVCFVIFGGEKIEKIRRPLGNRRRGMGNTGKLMMISFMS